jgi:hypothetical protein
MGAESNARAVGADRAMAVVAAIVATLLAALASAPDARAAELDMYEGTVDPATFERLRTEGYDVVAPEPAAGGYAIDIVLTDQEKAVLEARGIELEPFTDDQGRTQQQLFRAQRASGFEVWRDYDGFDGLRAWMGRFVKRNKKAAKLFVIGQTQQGRDIVAVRVSSKPRKGRKGKKDEAIADRPAVLYQGTTHAREWISTEVTRRMMEFFASTNPKAKKLRRTRQLWFVPVLNPDGYQYTFDGERLWRKNLRDNDGNGQIAIGDGVDLNRNYPYRWGYDNEGSAGDPSDDTYRGPSPASEPETQANIELVKEIDPVFSVSYHSYGPLLLFPQGWQVQTPTADDPIYVALSGTDAKPAVKGFDPDLSAELYTTNGEFTDWAHARRNSLAWTPELEEGCDGCGFVFPDDEGLVERQFRINKGFAVDLARSAANPADPISRVGKTRPMYVDTSKLDPERAGNPLSDLTFDISYGDPQPVRVLARNSVREVEIRYQVNGGEKRNAPTRKWNGGDTYDTFDSHYRYYRGEIVAINPGDEVKVWFTGREKVPGKKGKKKVRSAAFTFEVASETDADVLILSAEDYTGASPDQAGGPAYLDSYKQALEQAGYTYAVYDVDARGRVAPDALGVLDHFDAVVWYTGDDVVTRAKGMPAGTASRLANHEMLEMRAYLNDGGKVLYTGQFAGLQYQNAYFYDPIADSPCNPDDPSQTPACLILSDDFLQYDLGAYGYFPAAGVDAATGDAFPVAGVSNPLAGTNLVLNGPGTADNQVEPGAMLTTSSVLPPGQFPQFASTAPAIYDRGGPQAFEPFDGGRYAYSNQANSSYKRLSREIDLSAVLPADDPVLSFQASYDIEPGWDYLMVEARTAGQDDWTTLPALDGNGDPITSGDTGASCPSGWSVGLHPFLARYQTLEQDGSCTPTGTSGEWNAASGRSPGWQEWNVDLSAYAGEEVELSITYASDDFVQNLGAFVDDIRVSTTGGDLPGTTSFEQDADPLDGWSVPGPPPGSPGNANDWTATGSLGFDEGAAVATDDSLMFGFGLEGAGSPAKRAEAIDRSLAYLLGEPYAP